MCDQEAKLSNLCNDFFFCVTWSKTIRTRSQFSITVLFFLAEFCPRKHADGPLFLLIISVLLSNGALWLWWDEAIYFPNTMNKKKKKNHPHLGFRLKSQREGISRCFQRDYSNESSVSTFHLWAFASFWCENTCNLHFKDQKKTHIYTSKKTHNTNFKLPVGPVRC